MDNFGKLSAQPAVIHRVMLFTDGRPELYTHLVVAALWIASAGDAGTQRAKWFVGGTQGLYCAWVLIAVLCVA